MEPSTHHAEPRYFVRWANRPSRPQSVCCGYGARMLLEELDEHAGYRGTPVIELMTGPDTEHMLPAPLCTFPGCWATFHAHTVAEPGPHNDPPGVTGWRFDLEVAIVDDETIGVHDHSTDPARYRASEFAV